MPRRIEHRRVDTGLLPSSARLLPAALARVTERTSVYSGESAWCVAGEAVKDNTPAMATAIIIVLDRLDTDIQRLRAIRYSWKQKALR